MGLDIVAFLEIWDGQSNTWQLCCPDCYYHRASALEMMSSYTILSKDVIKVISGYVDICGEISSYWDEYHEYHSEWDQLCRHAIYADTARNHSLAHLYDFGRESIIEPLESLGDIDRTRTIFIIGEDGCINVNMLGEIISHCNTRMVSRDTAAIKYWIDRDYKKESADIYLNELIDINKFLHKIMTFCQRYKIPYEIVRVVLHGWC